VRRIRSRFLVGGAAVVALALALTSSAQASGITAPGFMRLRLFNGTRQTNIVAVTVTATTGTGGPVQLPLPPLPPGGLISDGTFSYAPPFPPGMTNVSSVSVTLTLNTSPASSPVTTAPFTWNAGDTIGGVYVIVSDPVAGQCQAEMQYSLFDSKWMWVKQPPVALTGSGGCPIPPPASVSFTQAYLYNATTSTISTNTLVLRLHSPTLGFFDSMLSSPLAPGLRWHEDPPGFADTDAVATAIPGAPSSKAIVGDLDRQVYAAFFVYGTDPTGNLTMESHGIVHRNDGPPYWEFR